MFNNDYTTLVHIKQQQQAVHDSIRAEHDGNHYLRLNSGKVTQAKSNWWHVLSRLHRIRIQISFDLEEPSPKPEGARY